MNFIMGILWGVLMIAVIPDRWSDKKRFVVFTISLVVMALPLVLIGKLIERAFQ